MKKKLFLTAVTAIAIIALSASTGFNSLAKAPTCEDKADRPIRPDNEAPHSAPDSRDPIANGPRDSNSADTMDCPPDYEEEEARRIKMDEGDIIDSTNQNNANGYSIIDGDAVITFDGFGVGIVPDSVTAKEGDVFYWKDGNGDVWRLYSTPDGPLLDDNGFHPEQFYKYDGGYNNLTWQEYFGAKKIGKAKLTIEIPETMK